MKKKLVLISVDALNSKDFDFIKTLPTFGRLIRKGAVVKSARSVYPSVTYNAHSSIVTGHYPDEHGVYNNEIPNPKNPLNQDWRWFKTCVKKPTVFDLAMNRNYSVGAVFWPCMAGANFKYNIPEIFSPDKTETLPALFLKYGTWNLLPVAISNAWRLKGITQPSLDNFALKIATYVVKRVDFSAIHFTALDSIRHRNGLNSKQAYQTLIEMDDRIFRILRTLKRKDQLKNATIVILGDHGTADFDYIIELNTYLKKEGLLKEKYGRIVSYKAYANTCGGSVQIHLNDMNSEEDNEAVKNSIMKLKNEHFIKRVFTKQEAEQKYHLSGDFDYVLEASDGYVFRNTVSERVIKDKSYERNCYKGDHGYLPKHKDMRTMMILCGKGIKKGAVVEKCNIVDFAPTIAKLLGFDMYDTSGSVLSDLLI